MARTKIYNMGKKGACPDKTLLRYNLLSFVEKKVYCILRQSIEKFEKSVVFPFAFSTDEYWNAARALLYDDPLLSIAFYTSTCRYKVDRDNNQTYIELSYKYVTSREENETLMKRIQYKIHYFIENIMQIKEGMNDIDKVEAVYKELSKRMKYSDKKGEKYPDFSRDVLCMEYGNGVCEGIAKLFLCFLSELGVPCMIITGDHHAWNIAYVNGGYKHFDLTWDLQRRDVLKYFCMSDNTARKNHHKWEEDTGIPKCA